VPVIVPIGSLIFQSTCLREARLGPVGALVYLAQFQSTCLREARPRRCKGRHVVHHFNPRAYVRHDSEAIMSHLRAGISIHVPT